MTTFLRRPSSPPSSYRPRLDLCEDRIALGDAVLGSLLGSAWLGNALAPAFADPVAAAFVSPSLSTTEDAATSSRLMSGRQSIEQVQAVRLQSASSSAVVASPAADALFSKPGSTTRPETVALTAAAGVGPGGHGSFAADLHVGAFSVAARADRQAPDLQAVANFIQPGTSARETPTRDEVRANLSEQPLYFEANQGQVDARVDFLARAPGYTLYVSATEAAMQLQLPGSDGRALVSMHLVGGNAEAQGVGEAQQPGTVSYFVGNDPSRWVAAAPTYTAVRYDEVYAGVDVRYYGQGQQLEYDFLVQPGANPDAIRLAFTGTDRLEIDASGELLLHTGSAALRQHRPFVYQEVGGARQEVASAFELREEGQIGFRLGAYDATQPLVIDPVIVYSTYVGGSGLDAANAIEVNPSGEAYVAGQTTSVHVSFMFPSGGTLLGTLGSDNAFVTKLSPSGAHLGTVVFGGSASDIAYDITVSPNTYVYIVGETSSCNFPTAGIIPAHDTTCNGGKDAFLTVFDSSLSTPPLSSSYLGGSADDVAYGVGVYYYEWAIITGYTESIDYPVTGGAVQPAHSSGGADRDAFVTQINPTFVAPSPDYSTYLGDAGGNDVGRDVVYDPVFEGVYVTGYTDFVSIPSVSGITCLPGTGGGDGWVFKFQGNTVLPMVPSWFAYVGDAGFDDSFGVAFDQSSGNLIVAVAGETNSPIFNNFGFPTTPYAGGLDAFVARLFDVGATCFPLDHTFHGGVLNDGARGIDLDTNLESYITGYTEDPTFPIWNPPTGATYANYNGGVTDAFVAHLDLFFNVNSSFFLGGQAADEGRGIAYEGGFAHAAGRTDSTFGPPPTRFPTVLAARPSGAGPEGFATKVMVP